MDIKRSFKNYTPENIYNCDETGLIFRGLPDRTLSIGSKKMKDRITVMVSCNMTGSNKHPLMVIGKRKNPRCFKGIKTLPVNYVVNKPCDMGIIKSLKHNYRLAFLQRVIAVIDSDDACLKSVVNSITLLDALHMLKMAWREVKIATIYNCFRKAGFHEEVGENMFSDIEYDEITMDVANEDEECIGIMSDEEICLMSRDISCEGDEDPIPVKTTSSEAMGACRLIRQFLTNSDLTNQLVELLCVQNDENEFKKDQPPIKILINMKIRKNKVLKNIQKVLNR
ncbi:tigger transposable element-derived protein 4-like [Octopus sinensis]|uniref:Tigger transposable element-derived protein 4-like n=1 Tax=Octopus sinensis TaxID=2607531 RepID=A0A6P7U1M0_9MOLL|nr:tigger transposable element-derived protein 4-like [Octopus sinensis]